MIQLSHSIAIALVTFPIGLAIYFLLKKRNIENPRLLLFCGPQSLLRSSSKRTRSIYITLFSLFICSLITLAYVIAGPFISKPLVLKSSEGIDLIIALDVSESMDADDFEPSRIDVARNVIKDFIRHREGDRIGVVIFSGDAVTKVPLTHDYNFLISQVEDIRLRELKQGTAIGMGLANAIARLRKSESKTKVIILLTDGDSNVGAINPMSAANLARQEGIKIYTIGIGKSDRVVVPIYEYDLSGRRAQLRARVPSYLNPELLQDIARLTDGKAYMARDPGMLSRMVNEIDKLEKTKVKEIFHNERIELFFYPALIATILFYIIFILRETRFRKAYAS